MTTTPIELGATVTYNGERGIVTGFGSLAAAFAKATDEPTRHPSAFVVQVAMGRYGIERHLRASELRRFS